MLAVAETQATGKSCAAATAGGNERKTTGSYYTPTSLITELLNSAYQFSAADLEQQHRVKRAFDPELRFNPGKVYPTLHRCAELGREHVHSGAERFPDLPRF